uniref:Annexin n=1 Tax=Steinernema glaseri TaxID=37863 RepID=A0A1I7Y1S8_9BILA
MAYYGTVRPNRNFDSEVYSGYLEKAFKGSGCDKDAIVRWITGISNAQRQMLRTPYKQKFGKDLVETLKKELSGPLEELMVSLMETPTKYDVMQLHKAVKGIGTTEKILIEILCSRTNDEITAIRNVYQQTYGRSLEKDIVGDTSGDFKRLLVSLIAGARDQGDHVDDLKANQDARKLYQAGEKRLGTDESCFNAILVQQSFRQLDRVFVEYEKVTGHPIEEAIEKEFSGDVKKGYLALVRSIQNRPRYFAFQLNKALKKGFGGINDNDLIRVIVSRSEIDLSIVKSEYERFFKEPLVDAINKECKGAYRDALLNLVKGNN